MYVKYIVTTPTVASVKKVHGGRWVSKLKQVIESTGQVSRIVRKLTLDFSVPSARPRKSVK